MEEGFDIKFQSIWSYTDILGMDKIENPLYTYTYWEQKE